jgi:hypothetical protein
MSPFPAFIRSYCPAGSLAIASMIRSSTPIWSSSEAAVVPPRCAVAFNLKTFFAVVDKAPSDVVAADVFDFLAHQRGDRTEVRITDGVSALSARTIAQRIPSVSGLYGYLVARGDAKANPVPRGLTSPVAEPPTADPMTD